MLPSRTDLRPRSALYRYQRQGVDLIKALYGSASHLPGLILGFDMGSGKTATCLTAVRDLLDEFVIRKVLIVAPLFVAQVTWPVEIEETWQHTAPLSYTLLRAEDDDPEVRSVKAAERPAAKERLLARRAAEPTEIHIINKEALPWLVEHFNDGATWPYDFVIVDENIAKNGLGGVNGRGRNATGKRTRFAALMRVRRRISKIVFLTGTPCPNGLINLWGLGYGVDLGERLGRTKKAFEDRWFKVKVWEGIKKIKPKDGAQEEIVERLTDVMFSLDPKDLTELPEMVTNIIRVRLPAKAMTEYRQFEKTLVSEVYDVEAVSRGVLTNKLLQFANGSMYQEDGNDVPIHDAKLAALETIVEEAGGAPILLFYNFKFDLARIRRRYPKAVVLNEGDPRATIKRWSAGHIELLLAHRASAGHGTNLQYGGNIMVQYGLTHDLELYQQGNKRLHRPGQRATVWNHHIVAEGTIDEDVLPVLSNKAATQDLVLETTRMRILRG